MFSLYCKIQIFKRIEDCLNQRNTLAAKTAVLACLPLCITKALFATIA